MRAMEFKDDSGRMIMMMNLENKIGQFPYQSPTVFNYYLPDYALQKGANNTQFVIKNAMSGSRLFALASDVGTISAGPVDESQLWLIEGVGSDKYAIRNVETAKCLFAQMQDGVGTGMPGPILGEEQLWLLEGVGSGKYIFRNVLSTGRLFDTGDGDVGATASGPVNESQMWLLLQETTEIDYTNLVAPEFEILDTPSIIDFNDAMLSIIEEQGLSSCEKGFGVESFSCNGTAHPTINVSGTAQEIWSEMDLLLTGGRLGKVKDVLMEAYGSQTPCAVMAYEGSGSDFKSRRGPCGPYSSTSWTDTCNGIDTIIVPEGCTIEVASARGGQGTKWGPFSTNVAVLRTNPRIGYDRIRSIRILEFDNESLEGMAKREVQGAQYSIVMTPHFHTQGNVTVDGKRVRQPLAGPGSSDDTGYKAVVMLYLFGGADTFNMLVPMDCELYSEYLGIRRGVALAPQQLIEIETVGQACSKFGIHSGLGILKELYDTKEAAFVTNVGNLIQPGQGCPGNFGHSTMQHASQTLVCQMGTSLTNGGGGRMADALLQAGTGMVSSFSLTGNVPWSQGINTKRNVISGNNAQEDDKPYRPGNVQRIIDNLTTIEFSTVYAKEYVNQFDDAVSTKFVTEILQNAGNVLELPAANYGGIGSLKQVATLIGANEARQAERDFFIVGLGGFDNHRNLASSLAGNFANINGAITAFVNEMKAQGNWDKVVLATQSDFARTLDPNGNMGTDHAWAGQHFILSGAINGGRIYNDFPESLAAGNPADLGRGRLVPKYPYESFMVPIAQWLGVQTNHLPQVFPNLPNFNSSVHLISGLFN